MSNSLLESLMDVPPYSLTQDEKRALLIDRAQELTRLHYDRCKIYRNLIDRIFSGKAALKFDRLEDAPYLPVSLFKTQNLFSVDQNDIVKTMTSSGTSGQAVSRIHLDASTAQVQTKTLVKIMQHFLGVDRRPMVFLESKATLRDRRSFSARAAGVLGMLPFGRQPFFALNEDMSLDFEGLEAYLEKTAGQEPVFFGFTFMVWKHFVQEMERQGHRLMLPGAVLLHSGGWKKLEALKVDPDEFRRRVQAVTGIESVINYYGMVEQVGSVYLENSLGFLHASNYSDVIVRDTNTLEPLPPGRAGVIQVVSALPTSYPGHSLLTEDLGVVEGFDNPETGMNGKYFRILGRIPRAELRGCSDTFQQVAV